LRVINVLICLNQQVLVKANHLVWQRRDAADCAIHPN